MLTRIWTLGLAACVLAFGLASGPAQEKEKPNRSQNGNDRPATTRVTGEIMSIQQQELAIKGRDGTSQTLTVRPATKITLDGKQASLDDLQKGDRVEATVGERDVIQSLAATRSAKPSTVGGLPAPPVRQVAAQNDEGRGERPDRDSSQRNDEQSRDNGQRIQNENAPGGGQSQDARAELGVNLAPSRTVGVRITSIDANSAASRAGLRNGDYILSINGQTVSSVQEVQQAIAGSDVGEECRLSIWRNGQTQEITAQLGERRQAAFRAASAGNAQASAGAQNPETRSESQPKAWLGVSLGNPEEGAEGALVRGVFPSGPAARAGFRSGDRIIKVNEDEVKDAQSFVDALDKMDAGKEIEFLVMRNGEEQTLKATLADRSQFGTQAGFERGGGQNENDGSAHAMMLEHNRRLAEQHQRLEERLEKVLQELEQIRKQLGTRPKGE